MASSHTDSLAAVGSGPGFTDPASGAAVDVKSDIHPTLACSLQQPYRPAAWRSASALSVRSQVKAVKLSSPTVIS